MRRFAWWAGALALSLAIAVAIAIAVGGRDVLRVGRLELLRPRALFALAALPLVFAPLRGSLVDLRLRQQLVSAAVRALLVALAALALARPSTVSQRHAVATVLLVDVSDSISDRQLEAAARLIDEARRARRDDDELKLVTFAAHPRAVTLPPLSQSTGAPLPPLERPSTPAERGGSDLAAALRLAYGLYPPGMLRRALLVSDGNETAGDLAAEALAARDRGVRVSVVSFAAEQDDELLVRALRVPPDVKIGAPFEVSAEIHAARPQRAMVTLYRDEFVNPREGRREVDLVAGPNIIHWKTEVVSPGFTTFRARLSAASGATLRDHFAANNEAMASVAVRGKPRVLYIEGESASSAYLANALRKENIDVEVRGPGGLPASPRELGRYDLVLLSDVAATFVGAEHMDAIERYVRDLGGGFIMAGGENSFGSGGWSGSRMEKLLPVRFDLEKKRDQPQLALVLAIDRSGSMTGEKIELAKEAAKATAELLGPEDLIGVIAFDSMAQAIVRLQRAANRVRIAGDIARLQPGGGTNILPALKDAYETLDPAQAKVKHVILLTDGQASYDGIGELVDEMSEHKITVSAVGVGTGADKTLLTMIAERGGGRFYFTQDAQNIPRIFTKETTQVARSALVEEAVGVHVQKHVELLDGTGIAEAPPLHGYVSTKPKPMGEVILVSDLGEPILARWRVGLGQAVAFTGDVKNRWAVEWLRWPGYGRFFAHLVRSTMRQSIEGGTASTSYDLQVDVDPPHARVSVDAVGADDRFVSGLETTLQVIDPAHPEHPVEVPLPQTAAGRYEGELTLDRYGSFLLRAVHKRDGVTVAESSGTLSLPYPREYLALPPDDGLLARVAEVTGGRVRPPAPALFDAGGEEVPWHRELWSWALWAAAALLVIDVALRRVRLAFL
jgi:secreted protein with Ig-like and vWFA domain